MSLFIDYWYWIVGSIVLLIFLGKKSPKPSKKTKVIIKDYVQSEISNKEKAHEIIIRFASDIGTGNKGAKYYLDVFNKILEKESKVINEERGFASEELEEVSKTKEFELKRLEEEKGKYDYSEEDYKAGLKEIEFNFKDELKGINKRLNWCNKQQVILTTDFSKPLKFILTEAKKCWNEDGWNTYFHFTEDDYPSIEDKIPN